MKKGLLILSIVFPLYVFSQPNVNAIYPAQGNIGSTISIFGTGFSSVISENFVYFGNIQAEVLSSSESQIQAIVPNSCENALIFVYTNGLMSSSALRFDVTFDALEELSVTHFSNQLYNPHLGRKYYDIKIADMNGDNVAEIVTSEAGYGSSAYLAIFTTSFDDEGMISIDQHIEFNFGTGVYSVPQDIALGDLNGDGLLDVVLSEQGDVTDDFEAHTCIFINNSQDQSFSFEPPIIIDGDGYEGFVQLQDINDDGKLDIVTTKHNQLGVYLNTSNITSVSFSNKIIVGNDVANGRPAFADLNGDGMIDMVATTYSTYSGREVYVYSNNSTMDTIDFSLEVTVSAGGLPPVGFNDYNWGSSNPELVDLNGDGKLDIVVTNGNCGSGCSPSGISIIKNISTSSALNFEYNYSAFYQYQSNSWPQRINIADLNGDGKPDLLTNDWMGGISILVNSSTSDNISLNGQIILGVGGFPRVIATSDLNMDSTPEIIVANWEVEGLRVIHNFIPTTNEVVYGCIDTDACNFNEEATNSDSSCIYPELYFDCEGNCINDVDEDLVCDEIEVLGCIDNTACNYNPFATDEDDCTYPDMYYDCEGNCINDIDNDEECDEVDYDDGLGIDEVGGSTIKLIRMIDVLGREYKEHKKGNLLFYIYDNGKTEKKVIH